MLFSAIGNRLGYLLAGTSFLYILFSLIVYAIPSLQDWQPLAFVPIRQFSKVTPPFADLAMLTHSARCDGSLSDLFDGRVNCDPYGRLFTYPPMALWMFSALGLSSASLGWLGVAMGASVALLTGVFFFALIPSAAVAGFLLALAYLSLPFQLTLERANNDQIVYLLLCLLALAMARGTGRSAAAGAALAFVAVATKLLPIFGIFATQLLPPGWESRGRLQLRHLRWALVGGVAGLSLVVPWLGPILRNSPVATGGILSHGLMAHQICYDWMADFHLSKSLSRLLAFSCLGIKLMFLLLGFVGVWRQAVHHSLRSLLFSPANRLHPQLIAVTISLFTGTWVGTYLFTKSYDYKFIFLLPVLAFTGALLCRGATGKGHRFWITLILVPMLLAWFTPYLTISFSQPMGLSLELVNDFVMIPVLAGALLATIISFRSALRAIP